MAIVVRQVTSMAAVLYALQGVEMVHEQTGPMTSWTFFKGDYSLEGGTVPP